MKSDIEDVLNPLFKKIIHAIEGVDIIQPEGVVQAVSGNVIKSNLLNLAIGEICMIKTDENHSALAEVVGFNDACSILLPFADIHGVSTTSTVIATSSLLDAPVGDCVLGRIINGFGQPIDHKGPIRATKFYPIYRDAPDPISRPVISEPLGLGVRAIDGLLTMGVGQRMGVFANAGGGKSTLLSSIVKGTEADIIVISLIGERGREVNEFIENNLNAKDRAKTVIVCSTSDKPALEISRSAFLATAIAEYFRDQGMRVMLMMDSITRFCRARRSIGLAAGEPPARRGFPPSVFDALPKLLERAGTTKNGSISAVYTVLVEGEDSSDPIAEEVRSILDGHIILSRELAASNHYPAIDINKSTSRVMNNIISKEHSIAAGKVRNILAKYKELELLLRIGEYKQGLDKDADFAISKMPDIKDFLIQQYDDSSDLGQTVRQMCQIVN